MFRYVSMDKLPFFVVYKFMFNTILGTKSKMTQTFVGDERVSVTVVKVTPNIVTQVKSQDKDGYLAVQIGTGAKKTKNITKPLLGHFKKTGQGKFLPHAVIRRRTPAGRHCQGDCRQAKNYFGRPQKPRLAALHHRAAEWHRSRKEWEAAIDHKLAAGDKETDNENKQSI